MDLQNVGFAGSLRAQYLPGMYAPQRMAPAFPQYQMNTPRVSYGITGAPSALGAYASASPVQELIATKSNDDLEDNLANAIGHAIIDVVKKAVNWLLNKLTQSIPFLSSSSETASSSLDTLTPAYSADQSNVAPLTSEPASDALAADTDILGAIGSGLQNIWGAFSSNHPYLATGAKFVGGLLLGKGIGKLGGMLGSLSGGMSSVGNIFRNSVNVLKDGASQIWSGITNQVSNAGSLLSAGWNAIKGLFS